MSASGDRFLRIAGALHALDSPPPAPGWNLAELIDLLPDQGRSLRQAAVLVGIVERAEGWRVLLTRRTDSLRHHPGQISFPGGRIEDADTDPVGAALREAREEVGLDAGSVQALGYLDPFVTITGFHVFPVVARIVTEFVPRIDPSEVAEAFEVPFDFLMEPLNAKELEVEYRGGRRALVEFRYADYRIWGATAAMLVNFRQRLEATT